VALDGKCQRLPNITLTSPQIPNSNLCNGSVFNITSAPGGHSRTVQLIPSAQALSSTSLGPATINSTFCQTSLPNSQTVLNFTSLIGSVVFVNCTTTDTNRLSSSCLFSVFTEDKEKPQVTCPADQTISPDPDAYYASNTLAALTAALNVPTTSVFTPNSLVTMTDNDNQPTRFTHGCNTPQTINASAFPTVVSCFGVDPTGNQETCQFNIFVVDTQPPKLTGCVNIISNISTVNWAKPTANDNLNGNVPVTCNFNGTSFPGGQTTIVSCWAADLSGNNASCSVNVSVVDPVPPYFLQCSNIVRNTSLGNNTGYLPCPNVTAQDNIGVTSFTLPPIIQCNQLVPIGIQYISFKATDGANNIAFCNVSIAITDMEPPVFTSCPISQTLQTELNKNTSAPTYLPVNAKDNSGTVSLTYSSALSNSTRFYFGTTTITITASDPSGNTATCTFSIQVVDSQKPNFLNCPSNSSYTYTYVNTTSPGQPTGVYALPTFAATDNVQMKFIKYIGNLSVYSAAINTLITVQALDSSDNEQLCKVNVLIQDKEPPSIANCPNSTLTCQNTLNDDVGLCSWSAIQFSDNTPQGLTGSYSSNPAGFTVGSAFKIGSTFMTFQAQDAAGNVNTCNFTVVIQDSEPPSFTFCPAALTAYTNATDSIYAGVTWGNATATDNSGHVAVSVSDYPGVYQIGLYNITTTATDPSGNTATCKFTVLVLMNQGSAALSQSSSSILGPVAGAGGAGGMVVLLMFLLLVLRRRNKEAAQKLQEAQMGYAELFSNMSDELILERANQIKQTLLQQKQVRLPAFEAQNVRPDREFQAPPATTIELISYITDTLKRGLDRNLIVLGSELGHGEFGAVFEGTFKAEVKEIKVAVKQLLSATSEDNRIRFLKEAAIMAQFNHANIVSLIGVCVHPTSEPTLIVLEYMHLGSLYSFLQSDQIKNMLEQLSLVRMAIDVSAGMHYLSEAGFVHRDLAARNVLIDKEMTCRIGDFGLSIDLATVTSVEENAIYSGSEGARLPIRWTAIEAILYRHFSTASDVWSFGVLLWEIWTYAEMPYKGWTNKKVAQQIQNGYRLPRPEGCPDEVYKLMIDCWNKNPKTRIPFKRIASTLVEIWKDITASLEDGTTYGQERERPDSVIGGQLYDNNDTMMAPDEDGEEGEGYEGTLAETNLQDRSRKKKAASQNALYDVGESGESESETENGPEGPAQTALYDVGADESSVMTTKLINVPRPNSEVATLLMGKKKRSSIDLSQVLSSRNLGQRVTVKAVGSGVLTFVGPHHLHGEVFCGVELDEPRGESDGTFEGKQYFVCEAKFGVLVPLDLVQAEDRFDNVDHVKLEIPRSSRGSISVDALIVDEVSELGRDSPSATMASNAGYLSIRADEE